MTTAVIQINPLQIMRLHGDKPDPVFWPDGTATHGTSVGYTAGNFQFVQLEFDTPPRLNDPTNNNLNIIGLNGSTLRVSRNWTPRPLAVVKAALIDDIDAQAENLLQARITPGFGQTMMYVQKLQQARAVLQDANPLPGNYPLVAASLGVEGATLADVASVVVTAAQQWMVGAAQIERARLQAKANIRSAQTVVAAVAAAEAVNWP